jgi:uncharacterized paraquat-inducible protein A
MAKYDELPDQEPDDPADDGPGPEDLESDDDESGTESCPNCGAAVYEDAPRCPKCGQYIIRETRGTKWSLWVVLALLAAGAVAALVWMMH